MVRESKVVEEDAAEVHRKKIMGHRPETGLFELGKELTSTGEGEIQQVCSLLPDIALSRLSFQMLFPKLWWRISTPHLQKLATRRSRNCLSNIGFDVQ